MNHLRFGTLYCAIALLFGVACGDDVTLPDASTDASDDASDATADAPDMAVEMCDGVDALEEGGAGHADPLGSAAGEARAGQLPAGSLPDDPTDLLTWTEDDFVIANDRIALVIEAPGVSDGYDPWGGKPVGMARVEDGALVDPADFNEFILGVGRYTVEARSVGVIADGSDGNAAVLRVVGPLRAIPFIDDFAAILYPQDYDDIEVAIDYTLEPDSNTVDIDFTFASPRARDARGNQVILAFQKERMPGFSGGVGFVLDGDLDYLAFIEDGATSYALESRLASVGVSLEVSGTMLVNGERFSIPACGQNLLEMFRLHIGGPGVNGVVSAVAAANGDAVRTVTGQVTEPGGEGAEGVRVHAEAGERYLSRTLTDADGNFELTVPDALAVTLSTWRAGNAIATTDVAAEETTATLMLDATGFVEITAVEGADPVPTRVQVRPATGRALAPPANWGEPIPPNGRTHLVFPGSETTTTLRVPVGDSRVTVSRGMEYELGFNDMVTVAAGETVSVDAVLERVVDTPGVMCADYHIHTARSPDSPDGAAYKLRSAAGDGLEIPCRSDHEWIYSWGEHISREGLDDSLFGVTSLELTTFLYGHFGVFPLEPDPTQPNRGAIPWVGMDPPEVFESVRSRAGDPVLIINHPRGSTAGSYFSAAGYDPVTGEVERPEYWDEEFTIVEVFNDSSFDENPATVADWFSFLRSGRRVFAVGSSDSHKVNSGSPVGYPRTCLDLGVDTTEALRTGDGAAMLRDATATGRFYVSGGIHLSVTARGDVRPGGDVMGAMATEMVQVEIAAPSWVDVDTLEVWIDGEMTASMPIGAGDGVIRADMEVPVAIDASGSWVIFHAKGDLPLDPVHPGAMPFAVSQPIFFTR